MQPLALLTPEEVYGIYKLTLSWLCYGATIYDIVSNLLLIPTSTKIPELFSPTDTMNQSMNKNTRDTIEISA